MFSKRFFIVILWAVIAIAPAWADTYLYKSKNKIDFVKLDQAKKGEKEGGLRHPHEFSPEQIRDLLRSIHFNKRILLTKDIENRVLFDEGNVEFLAPTLIEGFKKTTDGEVVVVSYFTRDSKLVIPNDRLTLFRAFVKEDGLHLKFVKLYAKLLGDRTTMGPERSVREARGMRVALELQPGQNRISWDPEEIVFDLAYFAPGGVRSAKPEPTPSPKGKKESEGAGKAQAPEGEKTVRERLKELEELKKDELITEKEYERKRRELLKEL